MGRSLAQTCGSDTHGMRHSQATFVQTHHSGHPWPAPYAHPTQNPSYPHRPTPHTQSFNHGCCDDTHRRGNEVIQHGDLTQTLLPNPYPLSQPSTHRPRHHSPPHSPSRAPATLLMPLSPYTSSPALLRAWGSENRKAFTSIRESFQALLACQAASGPGANIAHRPPPSWRGHCSVTPSPPSQPCLWSL